MYFIGLIIQYSSDTEKAVELDHWGDPFEIAIKRCSRYSLSVAIQGVDILMCFVNNITK